MRLPFDLESKSYDFHCLRVLLIIARENLSTQNCRRRTFCEEIVTNHGFNSFIFDMGKRTTYFKNLSHPWKTGSISKQSVRDVLATVKKRRARVAMVNECMLYWPNVQITHCKFTDYTFTSSGEANLESIFGILYSPGLKNTCSLNWTISVFISSNRSLTRGSNFNESKKV